jgi:hypothetical protein
MHDRILQSGSWLIVGGGPVEPDRLIRLAQAARWRLAASVTCAGMQGYCPDPKQHNTTLIEPVTQALITAHPGTTFRFAGPLHYRLSGPNVCVMAPPAESLGTAS